MEFKINFGAWNNVFAVPTCVVDQHLKLAGENALKVLLWVLRHAGQPVNTNTIASELSLSQGDTEDCIRYWIEAELFCMDQQTLSFVQNDSTYQESNARPAKQLPPRPSGSTYQIIKPDQPPKLEPEAWAQRLNSDDVRFLFNQAETIFGRSPTALEQKELVDLMDWFAFPLDSVLMLLQYCKTTKKKGVRAIHAIAVEWVQNGITTHEQVEEYIRAHLAQYEHENTIRSAFHLRDGLSEKQKKFITRWFDVLGFDISMIKLAGDRTLNQTNKLSFDYMNSILESWYKKGITNPQQAMEEKKTSSSPAFSKQGNSSLDNAELDRLFTYGTIYSDSESNTF